MRGLFFNGSWCQQVSSSTAHSKRDLDWAVLEETWTWTIQDFDFHSDDHFKDISSLCGNGLYPTLWILWEYLEVWIQRQYNSPELQQSNELKESNSGRTPRTERRQPTRWKRLSIQQHRVHRRYFNLCWHTRGHAKAAKRCAGIYGLV